MTIGEELEPGSREASSVTSEDFCFSSVLLVNKMDLAEMGGTIAGVEVLLEGKVEGMIGL